ncbi:MAG: class I SAM-dependent methyltransferase [Candidatus Heimdallarchaeaceae archaeon]
MVFPHSTVEKNCYYCERIAKEENDYPSRLGIFSVEGIVHRCAWHAQFKCSECGRFHHFSWLYWCPETNKLVCGNCNKPTLTPVKFWDRTYSYTFYCKDCNKTHYDLLYSEYCGLHPWQQSVEIQFENLANRSKKIGQVSSIVNNARPWHPIWKPTNIRQGESISLKKALSLPNNALQYRKAKNKIVGGTKIYSGPIPEEEIMYEDSKLRWEENSAIWINHYELSTEKDEGDINRQLIIDPALLKQLGDVKGLKILDAGCGNGYFSRKLARRGAEVVGVDYSKTFIEHCINVESQTLLGCKFYQSSLTDLSFLNSNSFDIVISNVVFVDVLNYKQAFKEINRVLKSQTGRFIWSNLHPVFGRIGNVTYKLPFDTKRNEEQLYVLTDRYFDTGGYLISWGDFNPLWQIERTLEEYSKALYEAGFVIKEIIEPKPNLDLIQANPRRLAFDADRFPIFIIYDCLKHKQLENYGEI